MLLGMAVLIVADIVLIMMTSVNGILLGIALWGLHLGLTQGLLWARCRRHRAGRPSRFGVRRVLFRNGHCRRRREFAGGWVVGMARAGTHIRSRRRVCSRVDRGDVGATRVRSQKHLIKLLPVDCASYGD